MKNEVLQRSWDEEKIKLKQKFAYLTGNDEMFAEEKREEIFGKLQIRLGKTKEELQQIIATL